MSTGLSGTAQISGYFNAILEDALFVAHENAVMPNLVTNYNAQGWADRKVSVYPTISAQTVAETDDFANPTAFDKSAQATFTPAEIMAQVILTKRRIETDPQNARNDAARELGYAISDKIETDLVSLFGSLTTDASSTGGTASFSLQLVGNAMAKLRAAKVSGPFYVALHPYHWLDVWNEIGKPTTSVVASDFANNAMRDYFVTNLLGAQWFNHALIPISASTTATSAVFSREAMAIDYRRAPNLEPEYDASKRAWELNMNAGYAKGVLRGTYGAKITADATAP